MMNKNNQSKPNGLTIRRQVMGDQFVDKALNSADWLTEPLQEYINDHGWGATWNREGLDLRTRSLVTIAMLAALKAPMELKGHVRGALRNGCTKEEIREVLLHSAVYCGAPATQEAFRAAREILDEWDE